MILDLPLVLETRRNHALEHATLHILEAKYPRHPMAGHSNPSGYFIFGDFSTEAVQAAAVQALTRLRAGEHGLAIHAGCGTNLATAALLAATLAWAVLRGARSPRGWILRLLPAILLALVGLALAQWLGPFLQQKITTEAEVGNLQIVAVRRARGGRLAVHRVVTR